MEHLRFPEQRRLNDFLSLREYIEQHQNMLKNDIMGTKGRGTIYDKVNKNIGFIRRLIEDKYTYAEMVKLVDTRDLKSIVSILDKPH